MLYSELSFGVGTMLPLPMGSEGIIGEAEEEADSVLMMDFAEESAEEDEFAKRFSILYLAELGVAMVVLVVDGEEAPEDKVNEERRVTVSSS